MRTGIFQGCHMTIDLLGNVGCTSDATMGKGRRASHSGAAEARGRAGKSSRSEGHGRMDGEGMCYSAMDGWMDGRGGGCACGCGTEYGADT